MTLDDFIARARAARDKPGNPSFLVYTRGSHAFFHGELFDASPDALLVRQRDGGDLLILRPHVVAITTADDAALAP